MLSADIDERCLRICNESGRRGLDSFVGDSGVSLLDAEKVNFLRDCGDRGTVDWRPSMLSLVLSLEISCGN